tara:strand:- start:52 stop:222 length:171 start_codon:yes stop_codon:yes gene_type:complete
MDDDELAQLKALMLKAIESVEYLPYAELQPLAHLADRLSICWGEIEERDETGRNLG